MSKHEVISGKVRYARQAKVEYAIRMAKAAGIDKVGGLELGPDGTIRVFRATDGGGTMSVDDEVAQWRARKGR